MGEREGGESGREGGRDILCDVWFQPLYIIGRASFDSTIGIHGTSVYWACAMFT